MGRGAKTRLVVVAALAAGPLLVSSCGSGRLSPAGPSLLSGAREVEPSDQSDAGACGGKNASPPEPDDLTGVSLERFASNEEIVTVTKSCMQTSGAASDVGSGSAGLWGDAIGDAFGAGGLGLSGVGEGGGGYGDALASAQQFGMIGMLAASGARDESITNVQHASVDEGGIVKTHGDHFVVLRRGRLFTVRIDDLSRVSTLDAFAPGTDPTGAWYDEMLVAKDTVIVVGYSYARGGTEIGLFDIDAKGALRARSTYHLRSNDYYSSRNYASRLVGDKLVFYTPMYVRGEAARPLAWMPAMRKWRAGARPTDFVPIAAPTAFYKPLAPVTSNEVLALHTITTCDVGGRDMTCTARGVMGPAGRSFYVAPEAVYVWTTPWSKRPRSEGSIVYRMPLEERAEPTALRAHGAPIDQFSFLEESGHLDVVLRSDGHGDARFAQARSVGPAGRSGLALLDVARYAFKRPPTVSRSRTYPTGPKAVAFASPRTPPSGLPSTIS